MSEQPTEPTTQAGEAEPATEAPKVEDLQALIAELENDRDKYKSLAKKEEATKKEHWNRLQEIERANLSETEKAILEAEERGKSAAQAEFESQLRQARLEAAAATAGVPDEVLSLLDPSKVFTDDGEPNIELLASLSGTKRKFEKSASDLKIGAQSNANAGQLTRADLQRMSPPEIMKAKEEGRLDALMRGQL
ncbi:hypothetical protein [Spirillospora sp. NPDC047279]|uniref:hypothetical protein n=1 Tax=Spirillospora sp. NPDC047279 TaxID=3155478 RepID=UPI0033D9296A